MAATTSRTLGLLSLLQSHRHWSARELVDRLGVSDRTLRRDVERLRDLGYGIESLRGSSGGYRLQAGTGLPPLLLTDDEGVAIAVGLRSQATAGLRGAEHTTLSALAKIEQVLPPALRRRIDALQSHATAGAGGRGPGREGSGGRPSPEVDAELLGLLALGCRDSERFRFTYTDAAGESSSRIVEPYRLVPVTRRWYLLAWDRQREDWRTFRVDRVSDVFPTRVRFDPRPMSDDAARSRVEAALRFRERTVTASVILDLPHASFLEHFGWYAGDAVAVGASHTRWPLESDSIENLVMPLMWIPRGIRYRIEAAPEVLEFLAEQAAQFVAAGRAGANFSSDAGAEAPTPARTPTVKPASTLEVR